MGDKEVQGCARKCVATCIRGGGGKLRGHTHQRAWLGQGPSCHMLYNFLSWQLSTYLPVTDVRSLSYVFCC